MATHLEQELDELKQNIFKMADIAIESISDSVESLKKTDRNEAQHVIEKDTILDDLEVVIDNDCIRILVTRQPAAIHIRFVLAMLKINTDLERIGDLSVNIAKETLKLINIPVLKELIDIPRMAKLTVDMIRKVFKSLSERDSALAREVISMDNEVDELNLQIYRELFTFMAEDPSCISQALGLIMVSRALERIGDHTTNIAERAIYYIDGVDVRHGMEGDG